jgi:hypothetical protein
MAKWIFLLFFSISCFSSYVHAQSLDSNFKLDLDSHFGAVRSWVPPIFNDESQKVFKTPEDLKEEVQFWIKIYTQYTTQQGVFHHAGDITHILGEIDLSAIYANPKWGPIRKEKQAELFIKQERLFLNQVNICR